MFMTGSLFDAEGPVVQKGVEHLCPASIQQSLDGSPGYAHALACLGLIQSFVIAKPHGLQLTELQTNDFELGHGNAPGFEHPVYWSTGFIWPLRARNRLQSRVP
jgi:hypothetical protein